MASLAEIYDNAISPALRELPPRMTSLEALVMLFAIGLQESGFTARRQYGNGPARGFWQFEEGGGVHGVLTHPASRDLALVAVGERADPWAALETDDVLAATFARLLLWTDAKPLPKTDNPWGAWDYYLRTWRPGKPHPETWMGHHAESVMAAMELVG